MTMTADDLTSTMPPSANAQAPRIFVSVAEQSADEHAAILVRAFKQSHPDARFSGLAGPALQAEGAESFENLTGQSAMAAAAFKKIPWALRLMRRVRRYLNAEHYDAAVLVDSPALHLPMAKICQSLGIPVLFFIAPQTWAWGPPNWRNQRIRKRVDRLACIWPFEEPYFQNAGINARYVGHPSFDRLAAVDVSQQAIDGHRLGAQQVISLLPGSRPHVINEVLPGQLEIATALARRFAKLRVLAVAANDDARNRIEELNKKLAPNLPITLLQGDDARAEAIRAADLVLVASGTVTLEVAYWATPMIVMYNSNRWLYRLIGRWLIRTPWLSIPNIVAQRDLVPEYMPYYTSTAPIAAQAIDWLSNPLARQRIRDDLRRTIQPLVKTGAAANAAEELRQLLQQSKRK
ncbi:MAG: lipid-A-disaccharide synthase [Phycisphaerales bacterium]|nr:lipid-A-disaccharide synthase [Phycisphaerales bacterium]